VKTGTREAGPNIQLVDYGHDAEEAVQMLGKAEFLRDYTAGPLIAHHLALFCGRTPTRHGQQIIARTHCEGEA
jgi:hypothetical protein